MPKVLNRVFNKNFYVLFGLDLFFVCSSIFLSIFLRYDFIIPQRIANYLDFYFFLNLIVIKVVFFSYFGLYKGMWRYTGIWDMLNVFKANCFATLFMFLFSKYTFKIFGLSNSLLLIDFILSNILIGSSRIGVRIFFNQIYSKNSNKEVKNVVLIGAGDTGLTILRQTLDQPKEKIKVVGIFDDNKEKIGSMIHGVPIIGEINKLPNFKKEFDEILICSTSSTKREMTNIVKICKNTGKTFKTLPSIKEIVDGKLSLSEFREVSMIELLGRDEITLDNESINRFINGKRVLITGAGGSIGSELVRQCIKFNPAVLIMLDISEFNLFEIDREIDSIDSTILFKSVLCDIRDKDVLNQVFEEFKPQVVLHAAAYKHVPMQEKFPGEAIKTNVFGTMNLSEIAIKFEVQKFVLVSTDKAVKPTNVMGATKRLAELIVQFYNTKKTEFMSVRFGNVLGSSGSVIPIFQDQIKNGGPVTITDPEMQRYFMSVSEASQLILQAGAIGSGGEVFVLDMGEPLKILDIANELIRLSGYEPGLDISIDFIGPRPGEKKIEELILDSEMLDRTHHEKIFVLKGDKNSSILVEFLNKGTSDLEFEFSQKSAKQIRSILSSILPDYNPKIGSKKPVYLSIKAKA